MKLILLTLFLSVGAISAPNINWETKNAGNWSVEDSVIDKQTKMTIRDVKIDQARDCGTFQLRCTKANAPACNNACFFQYCRNGNKNFPFFTRTSARETDNNRYDGGCKNNPGGSPCRYGLFFKKFVLPNQVQASYCDEWPPASVRLDREEHAPSLRCMKFSENQNAGNQLNKFYTKDDPKKQPEKTCKEELNAGDTFKIKFVLEGKDDAANARLFPYCVSSRDCTNDNFQFFMSKKAGDKGQLSEPRYKYAEDSHYALSMGHDIRECWVELKRLKQQDERIQYNASILELNPEGNGIGRVLIQVENRYPSDEDPLVLDKAKSKLNEDLKIYPNGNGVKSNAIFDFGNIRWKEDDNFDPKGTGNPMPYCKPDTGNNGEQVTVCEFPCIPGSNPGAGALDPAKLT